MTCSQRGKVNWPITRLCRVITIITTISGTAATPFMTAVMNSALIGSIWTKLKATPISVPPAHGFRERVGAGAGQDRDRQQAGADDAQGEEQRRELAGDRLQRRGRLLRGLDVGQALLVQRCRCRDDDAEGDQVRQPHAEISVDLDAAELALPLPRRLDQRLRLGV